VVECLVAVMAFVEVIAFDDVKIDFDSHSFYSACILLVFFGERQ
jgi:hypothetical protein